MAATDKLKQLHTKLRYNTQRTHQEQKYNRQRLETLENKTPTKNGNDGQQYK